jgi:hypothetical protein
MLGRNVVASGISARQIVHSNKTSHMALMALSSASCRGWFLAGRRRSVSFTMPHNKGVQLTAYSVRSCVAPASGSS